METTQLKSVKAWLYERGQFMTNELFFELQIEALNKGENLLVVALPEKMTVTLIGEIENLVQTFKDNFYEQQLKNQPSFFD